MSKKWKNSKPQPRKSLSVTGVILASGEPSTMRLCGCSETLELLAQEATGDGKPKLRKFKITAYTGGAMQLEGFFHPVVVDLEGMATKSAALPILKSHQRDLIVGHTDAIDIKASKINLSGVMSGIGDAAKEVAALADNGFPWQASIGATVQKLEFVAENQTAKANGKTFSGPVYIARKTVLAEVSFVPIGGDGATSASIAANQPQGETTMNDFEKWVKAQGLDPATISDALRKTLDAAYKAQQTPEPTPTPKPILASHTVEEIRAAAAAESDRIAGIRRICASNPELEAEIEIDGKPQKACIQSHAIKAGWTIDKAELHFIRAQRPQAPVGVFANSGPSTAPEVIEAAMCMAVGMPKVEAAFKNDDKILSAAHKRRNIGLHQILMTAAAQNGYSCSPGERVHSGNLRDVLRAAFSTVTLPGILGNVANKNLLAGYMEEDETWREISSIKTANNFYQRTYYRMLDNMEYEEVGAAGEIKHGSVDQESYTANLKTYAKMFSLTRRDIINDDLGAFSDLRTRLGRGAKKKFNNLFWTNMLASHSTFFTTARLNYITGATTTLLVDGVGLGLGVKAFRQMKSPSAAGSDDGGKRIGGRPEVLLVPPELEAAAETLYADTNLASTTAISSANIYRNKYRPVVCPWLSDSSFTGYSTTAWYLFRAAADMAMMAVSFLNGNEMPTVESAEADFSTLGVEFRGYHDFYADQAEYLCGVKSKGAA